MCQPTVLIFILAIFGYSFTSAQHIDFISELDNAPSAFRSETPEWCPMRCLCFRNTVRCMFLHLDKIPRVVANTTILDLRFNRIRAIPQKSLQDLQNLTMLLLNNNHISGLKQGAFDGLGKLKSLYLYKNQIRHIESRTFDQLSNLEMLYLHQNYIHEIAPETFAGLMSLERLFLHNNKIERIPFGAFDHMHNLKRIRLDSNFLICDCDMMGLVKMLVDHPSMQTAATCQSPAYLHGKPVTKLQGMNLECRKPTITEGPEDVDVNFGNTVYFTCKADGDPLPDIVWIHNENQVTPEKTPRYSILTDGTLMIANAQDEDAGVYECMAKSSAGEAKSRRARMKYIQQGTGRPRTRPRFTVVPSDQEVREGDSISLHCEARGEPVPTIKWSKDESALINSSRVLLSRQGSMQIRSVRKGDTGVYRCSAVNALGKVATVAELRVQSPPAWIVTPAADQRVQLGESLDLHCEAEGTPEPTISWTQNGQDVRGIDHITLSNRGRDLTINRITQNDDGDYACRAENSQGYVETAVAVKVVSGTAPVFTSNANDAATSNVRPGGEINLSCSAHGVPFPSIIWRRNSSVVTEDERTMITSGGLILRPFDPNTQTGLYECSAFNDHGIITSDQFIVTQSSVRIVPRRTQVYDQFLINSVRQAENEVRRAENDSLVTLLGKMSATEIKSPVDMLKMGRFPRAHARDIVRTAEVYERALQIINDKLEQGLNLTLDDNFDYTEVLSPHQLNTISRFSGCIWHRPPRINCNADCFHGRYRSIDGSCNNYAQPLWGTAYTAFERLLSPIYENGFNFPIGWNTKKLYNGFKKPSARQVSTEVISTSRIEPDPSLTHMVMQWGQFLDHDLDHSLPSLSIESFGEHVSCRRTCKNVAPCFPIPAPEGDTRIRTRKCMEFTRSAAVCGSGVTSMFTESIYQRQQINQLTSFIDGSQVYGSSEDENRNLRNGSNSMYLKKGIYLFPEKPLLPFTTDETPVDCRRNSRESDIGCFLSGDIRTNEQLGLLAMHTVWFRHHNYLAEELREISPHWSEEQIFQESRKIVGAQMQHITYSHWLPLIIGRKGMGMLGPYRGYRVNVNPTISNEFATAALRFGHTLINPVLRRLDKNFQSIREGDVPLRSAFFSPWRLVEEGGVDPLLRGLFRTAAKLRTSKELLNSHLTDDLFSHAHLVALDLASMNIQRGRDHGLPSYNFYRKWCNLTFAKSFDDLSNEIRDGELRQKLQTLYGHVDNIDLWVGGVAEDPDTDDARVGPTFRCILIDQFRRLRDGDRFWYENPSIFHPEQLQQIRQTSLSRILCDNGDYLTQVPRDVFLIQSEMVNCTTVPHVNLSFWAAINTHSCTTPQIRHFRSSIDDLSVRRG